MKIFVLLHEKAHSWLISRWLSLKQKQHGIFKKKIGIQGSSHFYLSSEQKTEAGTPVWLCRELSWERLGFNKFEMS